MLTRNHLQADPAPEHTLLIRGGTVLAIEDGAADVSGSLADVLIQGNRIAMVRENLDVPAHRILDASGCVVMPGLVNAHFHSSELFVRGRYDGLGFDHWGLFVYPFLYIPPLPARLAYLRTLLAGIELLRNGVTAVTDDVAAEVSGQALDTLASVVAAYKDLGIRASCSGNVMNMSQDKTWPWTDSLPPASRAAVAEQRFPSVAAYVDFCDEAVKLFDDSDGLLRYVVAPVSPQWCTQELLLAAGELAARHGLNFHTHVLETSWQAEVSRSWQSGGFIPYLRDLGVLNERATLIHCVWLSPNDIELIGDTGAAVVHCPTANLRLGAGIAPVKQLLRQGVPVGLGTDGLALHDSPSVLEEARQAALISRARAEPPDAWVHPAEALRAATVGGARSMLIPDQVAPLAAGTLADLVILRERSLPTDASAKLHNRLLYDSGDFQVETVLVNGRVVYVDGAAVGINEADARAELKDYADTLDRWQVEVEKRHASLGAFFAARRAN
jgi:5-methylthioadenosine/S-adenosylhomocysteine deaminase